MKKMIKPTRNFLLLFTKTEKAKAKVPKLLAEITGYNEEWTKKNIAKSMEHLTDDQKKQVNDMFLFAQIVKSKMWADLYYSNFEKVKDFLLPPAQILYNEKKKVIELSDGKEIKIKLKRLVSDFKGILNKFSREDNTINPPKNL